ncbi:R3H domain-containing nucleic acid-binding protein [Chloroflexota bacterium]
MPKIITDDLDALLDIFPPHIGQPLRQQGNISELLEVVLDLGRPPEARFPQQEVVLSSQDVTEQDIEYVASRVGSFGDDNRAGIERTLHRISAIRNRQGHILGLTCRVGRAVFGTIKVIEDLVHSANSVLLLGRPGVGKTTMLREVARVLADDASKRVIIVDTSNEIAGDGDIPHPAIGHARRMQVTTPTRQHDVMIEAVENHMPEVIVIDEIGTELEAQAARTIAERGVQLIGTAHGNTLENLMMNPTLCDLIGGIQTVTLGDDEAKRRGTQKSVLERTSPPTFDIVVEIQDRDRVAIHPEVSVAVDTILRSRPLASEVRWLDEAGEVRIEKQRLVPIAKKVTKSKRITGQGGLVRVFPFGVNRGRLGQVAKEMGLSLEVTDSLGEADMLLTTKNYYRRKPQKISDAEAAKIAVYAVKSNTPHQIRQLLGIVFATEGGGARPVDGAITEAEAAVARVKNGQGEEVQLSPQSAYIRRLQHLIVERNDLSSRSLGKDPQRRVKIYKDEAKL